MQLTGIAIGNRAPFSWIAKAGGFENRVIQAWAKEHQKFLQRLHFEMRTT
jgi:hypothetical protein